jgi:DNA-binding NtrC family response regulator
MGAIDATRPNPAALGALSSTHEGRPRGMSIQRGETQPVDVRLHEDQRYVVGRHDAADVVFDDAAVSRLHGVLTFEGGQWLWEDYGSSNGSTIVRANGERVTVPARQPSLVEVGDRIEVGTDTAVVRLLGEVAQPRPKEGDPTSLSRAARKFEEQITLASRTRVPVFLLGPSGTGKTHSARLVHDRSAADGPFVSINCARMPQDPAALHSELLGHVKGAFTGAQTDRVGKLFLADGGTLFLDEVESLADLGQGFLLDVLEGTGDLSPLGARSVGTSPPIFRLVSASKRPLGESGLRADLCERLAEGHMWTMPTLEERTEDIPGLVGWFAEEQSRLLGVRVDVADDAIRFCTQAAWPGQIRQLRATVVALAQLALARLDPADAVRVNLRRRDFEQHLAERAAAFGRPRARVHREHDQTLRPGPALDDDEGDGVRTKADPRALTREQLEDILRSCQGNQTAAARMLGIARNTLARRVKDFDIDLDAYR